jgi:hypothetical protein
VAFPRKGILCMQNGHFVSTAVDILKFHNSITETFASALQRTAFKRTCRRRTCLCSRACMQFSTHCSCTAPIIVAMHCPALDSIRTCCGCTGIQPCILLAVGIDQWPYIYEGAGGSASGSSENNGERATLMVCPGYA